MFKILDQVKHFLQEIFKSRVIILIIFFCLTSIVLLQRVFYLQIVKGQEYLNNYKLLIQKTKEVQGTRGRILDCNGNVLADNQLAYSVTIEDNGDYDSTKEKNKVINETIMNVIDIVTSHGDSTIRNFKITLDDDDEYQYTMESETQRLRFLADVFGYATIDKLTEEQSSYSATELIDYLCSDKNYGIRQADYSKEQVLEMVTIRYAMSLNRFQKYVATTIASNVSEETTAAIMENLDSLQGVNISEESIRVYSDSKYFANILGYTGTISQDEYDNLDKEVQKDYSLTDIVGKAGIEQIMDHSLQGTKGEIKMYVNNVGKVIESVEGKEAGAGNDLTLTIDKNLQIAAYDLLEEKLAGIILSRMANVMNYDRSQLTAESNIIIPVDDVYYAFIGNEILNTKHFMAADASETEKAVYASFSARKEEVLGLIDEQLGSAEAPAYKDCSNEVQTYLSYICSNLLTSTYHVLDGDKIDSKDEVYNQWEKDESISLYTYLNYAISQNWIDTSKLNAYTENSTYSDSNEVYQAILAFVRDKLQKDTEFDKLIYKYMIKTERLSGTSICLLLYDQQILAQDDNMYQRLLTGDIGPYDFVRSKIQNLEITPGQLGLEPCTGSVVVTDTNTGKVLACVSYPGYDNNRLANSMDSSYYSELIHSQSLPLYNNATQEKTAPGSTYKPLVATAALTENIITADTQFPCTGIYEKITPSPKCWVYPKSHGSLSVVGAIQHSCNSFFYEVGYRMGETENENGDMVYHSQTGIDKLTEYATLFGLNETSGIEIPESEPQISTEDSVRSAIGQGTNNYTTTQLARYITTVANKGTVFDLSLLANVKNKEGEIIQDFEPVVHNEITTVSNATWNTVQSGMRAVVTLSPTYKSLGDFAMSGKTGTAQQSTSHANHCLFVGYAPSESPEIAFAIRIKNGYESLYASEIGRDIVSYYYGIQSREELIDGQADPIAVSKTSGD